MEENLRLTRSKNICVEDSRKVLISIKTLDYCVNGYAKSIKFHNNYILNEEKFINLGKFSKQRALVLGATGSLGTAISYFLKRDGSKLLLQYRDESKLKELNYFFQKENLMSVSENIRKSAFYFDFFKGNIREFVNYVAEFQPTHIYNCLSPQIFNHDSKRSEKLSAQFQKLYIEVIESLISKSEILEKLEFIFNPSSVFVENSSGTENQVYRQIKIDLERFASENNKKGDLFIYSPRLNGFKSKQTFNYRYESLPNSFSVAANLIPKDYLD
jgi:hypothetical protein